MFSVQRAKRNLTTTSFYSFSLPLQPVCVDPAQEQNVFYDSVQIRTQNKHLRISQNQFKLVVNCIIYRCDQQSGPQIAKQETKLTVNSNVNGFGTVVPDYYLYRKDEELKLQSE
ncbi:Hypothetical_protein [Hexamita inflata]|uniref:Hypothetical_protein n=1 Tax=Hexamita inflata TaxID=28002 RepID=A0AA86TFN8_9EUKA|nr:Hypothetical protein HINF_LOCUS3676 [Hexamita inflata]